MANVVRIAGPGHDWYLRELTAYNIAFVNRMKEEFFGTHQLPLPTQPSLAGFMTTLGRSRAQDDETRKLLHYLELASYHSFGKEAAVSIFLAKLLEKLGYDDGSRVVFTGHVLPFFTCGKRSVVRTDVCVLDNDGKVVLLVQGNRNMFFRPPGNDEDDYINYKNPEPPVIASAIAAYDANNEIRQRQHLDPLPHMTFPAIAMTDTSPIFYKITVTEELSTAVHTGTYPTTQTKVDKFVPTMIQGRPVTMSELKNRTEIMTYFNAFKQFLQSPQ